MSDQSSQKEGIEILCIGTEILLGNILNSNARWLAEELASLGLPHYFQTVVGDIMNKFAPGAIVLQCGADSLAGDRLGLFNLTLKGHAECV